MEKFGLLIVILDLLLWFSGFILFVSVFTSFFTFLSDSLFVSLFILKDIFLYW